ncbi:hypothetical protein NI459_00420 [Acinetobacter schindleri]|jgi:hypothetical protein|uniref:hypothetical protein n=1 Tax=Acinetobacter schindleri TaxID=108981 RepID=UPI00209AB248|nr:hypothetical protein [Acinetobacter schindleri]MCO8066122.1 hypothetical protein [Acinetobacter schindleri]
MNAAVTIMQTTDWSKFSFENWLRQFGAWINGDSETMVMVVKTMPTKRITQEQREQLLAMYMNDEKLKDRLCVQRRGTCCQIDNNEARAIHKLILDIQAINDEIVQEWVSALWSHYVMGNSLRDIAENYDTSVLQIRQDIKCGLAFIKSRYPRFKIDIFEKKAEKSA